MPRVRPLPGVCLLAPWRARDLPSVERRTRQRDDVSRPYRGVGLSTSLEPEAPTVRALVAAAAWPGVTIGGWAAAHLLGVPDMDGRATDGLLRPVVLCPGRSGRIAPREGVTLLRSSLTERDVVEVDGIPVTSPVRTAFDLARTARDLWAAVEEVDCVFGDRDAWFLAALTDDAAARPRWKGVDQARRAASLATVRSRSRGETWLRMVWTQTAMLPPPRLNAEVRDEDDHLVAVPDLIDEASGLVGEYDGAVHRFAAQQHADAIRGELMSRVGLTVVRATAIDRGAVRSTARRLLTAHATARSQPPGRWWVAAAPSAKGPPVIAPRVDCWLLPVHQRLLAEGRLLDQMQHPGQQSTLRGTGASDPS